MIEQCKTGEANFYLNNEFYLQMGYGKRALKLLKNYYAGHFTSIDEEEDIDGEEESDDNGNSLVTQKTFQIKIIIKQNYVITIGYENLNDDSVGLLKEVIAPRKKIPTLLKRLSERKPEKLDYIGTSFGLTKDLLKFWKSQKFVPVYLR